MSAIPTIQPAESAQTEVAPGVILDGRLALYHREYEWLTVADLHFGYELSQRAAGNLFPLWGMRTIETRLKSSTGATWASVVPEIKKLDVAAADGFAKRPRKIPGLFNDFVKSNVAAISSHFAPRKLQIIDIAMSVTCS